ncbi:flagellar hook-associated protein FlgK [Derxia lacustris]|uniref:flagellar hook-associated protein FlgK n=1 Tax=Derxia lacustris TaxID=764842 RepID=UPI000A177A70|nr:flagellar hook-associated protein FlgK [Derxia lacustris]
MTASLMSIGRSGLNAASMGIATTSHNIANVNTPGYARQQITQRASIGSQSGSTVQGIGVDVTGVTRAANALITAQVNSATAAASSASTQQNLLNRVADLLTQTETSITQAADDFFGAIQDATARPTSQADRQSVLSKANSFAVRTSDLDAQLGSMTAQIGQDLNTSVVRVNAMAQQIAQLNDQIATQVGSGLTPNDLLDQRDSLIRDMSKDIKVNSLQMPDGRVQLFLASGDPLVLQGSVGRLSVQPGDSDPSSYAIAIAGAGTGGASHQLKDGIDLGGTIGGDLLVQSDIASARNNIGRIAASVGSAFNVQQALGNDAEGNAGLPMFSLGPARVVALPTTTGRVTMSISDPTQLKGSDYRLAYDGSQWSMTRLTDGVTTTFSGLPSPSSITSSDGIKVDVGSVNAQAGDVFILQPTREAASDFRMLLRDTAKLASSNPVIGQATGTNTGTGSITAVTVDGPTRDPNLLQPVTLNFTSATDFTYSVNGGTAQSGKLDANGKFSLNGWSLTMAGVARSGDSFTIGPTANSTGDNRNLVAMAAIAKNPVADNQTLTSLNTELAGTVGNRAASMAIETTASSHLLDQITTEEQSVSAVNLDEEATNLLKYQQAYQAAAKSISIADDMFKTWLTLAG